MKETILEELRRELLLTGNEKDRLSGERFFKEEVRLYGMKAKEVYRISGFYFDKIRHMSKIQIFALCEDLWQSGYFEESAVACEWSYKLRNLYEPGDFRIFEHWVEHYVSNWASCDSLCNHTVGSFVEKFPGYLRELKKWAGSPNRWMRRAAAVSLIVPARKGLFLTEIFEIASLLLTDRDDMVQKGYGWMLKVASQSGTDAQSAVFDFVMAHKQVMPRTALRYAIEKMPPDMKKRAMEK